MRITESGIRKIIREETKRIVESLVDTGFEGDHLQDPYNIGETIVEDLGEDDAKKLFDEVMKGEWRAEHLLEILVDDIRGRAPGRDRSDDFMDRVLEGMAKKLKLGAYRHNPERAYPR